MEQLPELFYKLIVNSVMSEVFTDYPGIDSDILSKYVVFPATISWDTASELGSLLPKTLEELAEFDTSNDPSMPNHKREALEASYAPLVNGILTIKEEEDKYIASEVKPLINKLEEVLLDVSSKAVLPETDEVEPVMGDIGIFNGQYEKVREDILFIVGSVDPTVKNVNDNFINIVNKGNQVELPRVPTLIKEKINSLSIRPDVKDLLLNTQEELKRLIPIFTDNSYKNIRKFMEEIKRLSDAYLTAKSLRKQKTDEATNSFYNKLCLLFEFYIVALDRRVEDVMKDMVICYIQGDRKAIINPRLATIPEYIGDTPTSDVAKILYYINLKTNSSKEPYSTIVYGIRQPALLTNLDHYKTTFNTTQNDIQERVITTSKNQIIENMIVVFVDYARDHGIPDNMVVTDAIKDITSKIVNNPNVLFDIIVPDFILRFNKPQVKFVDTYIRVVIDIIKKSNGELDQKYLEMAALTNTCISLIEKVNLKTGFNS